MCRSIKTLHRATEAPSTGEVHAAALQFVRKVSGYRTPSRVNEAAFNTAVAEIATSCERLLDALVARPRPTTNGVARMTARIELDGRGPT